MPLAIAAISLARVQFASTSLYHVPFVPPTLPTAGAIAVPPTG
jgi:cytochrome bd-type quinol oxidase subunit 1